MSQQFEFGDWVEVTNTVDDDECLRECRYVFNDGSGRAPIMVYEPSANDYHWTDDKNIRPHPTKKREAFATLSVTHNAPIVLTGVALESAKQFIELAIKANNGGFNG